MSIDATRSKRTTNGGDLLVGALIHHGVERLFGFPGDTSLALYDALADRGADLQHILARDERHAAFMADAYARTSQRVGVCEAASGAGAVYLASGLAEALASRVSVLAIATDNNTRSAGTAPISEMNLDALFAACTIWRRTVSDPADLPDLVVRAFEASTTSRAGPVALIVPEDVLEAAVEFRPAAAPCFAPTRPKAAEDAVARAVRAIESAERPVIVVGGGVHRSAAWAQLRALVDRAALPVATTIHGKGALDERHPLALGVIGGNGARPYANTYVSEADCVVFVGTRANATDTMGFTVPPRSGDVQVVQIDLDAQRAIGNYPDAVAVVGDARTVLRQLTTAIKLMPAHTFTIRAQLIADARQGWSQSLVEPVLAPGILAPAAIVDTLRETLGAHVWITADAGTPTPFVAAYWEAPGDGCRVVIPRGHGPMGFALPAAIGVAQAHPDEVVVCLTTENSLAMAVAELETAWRLQLPIVVVVLDNTSLGWIKMLQHLYVDGRYFGVDPGPIDPVGLAVAMGMPGTRAHDTAELAAALGAALAARAPRLIHARVPEHMDAPPPVPTWLAALSGSQTGRPIH